MIHFLDDYINFLVFSSFSSNTVVSYKKDLMSFFYFFNNKNPSTTQEIILYFENLYNKKYSNTTINRHYSSINSFYKFLLNKNILNENPLIKINKIQEKKKIPKIISSNDIKKILNYYQTSNNKKNFLKEKSLIYLIIFTGMRVSEVCCLKKNTFKFYNKDQNYSMISVIGKRNKERLLPCNEMTINAVREFISISKNTSQYIFHSKSKSGHISRVAVLKLIKKLQIKLNIDYNISPHMFRHSFATNLINNNIDLRYLQDILGHSSLSTTAIYTEMSDQKIKKDLIKFHPEFKS